MFARHTSLSRPVAIFGAAPGTGNLGVDALALSAVSRLLGVDSSLSPLLAGYHAGLRESEVQTHDRRIGLHSFGLRPTRRFYLAESRVRVATELRLPWTLSQTAGILRASRAFLDISGGDSFTDLYGPKRFNDICFPKRLARRLDKPLILLPQTYGPFKDPARRDVASGLVRYAYQAWARDARSFDILRDLLGGAFDPARHRLGVDVAFQLPAANPDRLLQGLPDRFVGINISGLIWNYHSAARDHYGLKADYRQAVQQIVTVIARELPVVLVPHVLTPRGHYESDRNACEELLQSLPDSVRSSVHLPPDPANPCEAKGLIARCDWFLGTRMHATIAALSSGIPACAIAYSDKTLGVFETCNQGEHVHDPRRHDTDALKDRVICSFRARHQARRLLDQSLPLVLDTALQQMQLIASAIRWSDRSASSESRSADTQAIT